MYLRRTMSHVAIINLWPSLSEFADDLAVPYGTAKAMRRRGSIPVEYWPRVVAKAEERGLPDVSLESLVDAIASKRDTQHVEAAE